MDVSLFFALCFHLKFCPVHYSHAPTDFVLAALPHFQTLSFPVWSVAKDQGCKALAFSLYGKKYCKIVSASEAENCVRCLNRFPHFFSSKPFIHQVCLWCSGHLWSPSVAQRLSVSDHVCQRERLRADFPRAARRAHPPVIPTQHSNTSEAELTSEEAPGLSNAGKFNRCLCLPAHLDGITTMGRSKSTAHPARSIPPFSDHATPGPTETLCLPYGRIYKVHIISEHKWYLKVRLFDMCEAYQSKFFSILRWHNDSGKCSIPIH